MNTHAATVAAILGLAALVTAAEAVPPAPAPAQPYFDDGDGRELPIGPYLQQPSDTGVDDYGEGDLARIIHPEPEKRACVRRGGNCDHRPNDCCYNSSCRCNLWGANCRCQRVGLFQKWGK